MNEQETKVADRLKTLRTLSTVSSSLERVLAAVTDASVNINEVSQTISRDPVLAARVLRLANSSYFSATGNVATLSQAIMLIGLREVAMLVATTSIASNFAIQTGALHRSELWLHSCAVAEAARLVASAADVHPGQAHIAGLLHDLGKVALEEAFPSRYRDVVQKSRRQNVPLVLVEREVLGVDHAWAGAFLFERWRLPSAVVEAVSTHHRGRPTHSALANTVLLANQLADYVGLCDPSGAILDDTEPAPDLCSALGLSVTIAKDIAGNLELRRQAIEILHRESLSQAA